eukprot:6205629-Pleurochrysis_carterae.AAC.4
MLAAVASLRRRLAGGSPGAIARRALRQIRPTQREGKDRQRSLLSTSAEGRCIHSEGTNRFCSRRPSIHCAACVGKSMPSPLNRRFCPREPQRRGTRCTSPIRDPAKVQKRAHT